MIESRRASGPVLLLMLLSLAMLPACEGLRAVSDSDLKNIDKAGVVAAQADPDQQPLVIVDARPRADYEQDHIAGAISYPLTEVTGSHPGLRGAETIIVYGAGYLDNLAPAVAKRLLALRYAGDVYVYRGGYQDWQSQTPAGPDDVE